MNAIHGYCRSLMASKISKAQPRKVTQSNRKPELLSHDNSGVAIVKLGKLPQIKAEFPMNFFPKVPNF